MAAELGGGGNGLVPTRVDWSRAKVTASGLGDTRGVLLVAFLEGQGTASLA